MKKIILVLMMITGLTGITNSQVTTAQDFTMTDCASNTQNLYSYLDNNEVVIMEFFMTCASCQTVAQKLTTMQSGLDVQYPGLINFWVLAYTNNYSCATVNSFRNTYAPNAVALDSGAAQVAYYGGFGMPTTVVVAGSNHQVIYNSNFDGSAGDTAAIHTAIDNFFATMDVENQTSTIRFKAFPNPATEQLNIELTSLVQSSVTLDLVDMTGKVVKEISVQKMEPGVHLVQVSTSDLTDGVYFIRLNADGRSTQYKISVQH